MLRLVILGVIGIVTSTGLLALELYTIGKISDKLTKLYNEYKGLEREEEEE